MSRRKVIIGGVLVAIAGYVWLYWLARNMGHEHER
jgi:hypothetical protein